MKSIRAPISSSGSSFSALGGTESYSSLVIAREELRSLRGRAARHPPAEYSPAIRLPTSPSVSVVRQQRRRAPLGNRSAPGSAGAPSPHLRSCCPPAMRALTCALPVAARARLGLPSVSPPLPSTGSSRLVAMRCFATEASRTFDAVRIEPSSQEQLPTWAPVWPVQATRVPDPGCEFDQCATPPAAIRQVAVEWWGCACKRGNLSHQELLQACQTNFLGPATKSICNIRRDQERNDELLLHCVKERRRPCLRSCGPAERRTGSQTRIQVALQPPPVSGLCMAKRPNSPAVRVFGGIWLSSRDGRRRDGRCGRTGKVGT